MKKTKIPDREEEKNTGELDRPQGSQIWETLWVKVMFMSQRRTTQMKTVGSKTTRWPETQCAACYLCSLRCFSWDYKMFKNWGNFTLHADPKHRYSHCVHAFFFESFIIIIIIIIIIRISHFSALAGKYSPILGCSNQQD